MENPSHGTARRGSRARCRAEVRRSTTTARCRRDDPAARRGSTGSNQLTKDPLTMSTAPARRGRRVRATTSATVRSCDSEAAQRTPRRRSRGRDDGRATVHPLVTDAMRRRLRACGVEQSESPGARVLLGDEREHGVGEGEQHREGVDRVGAEQVLAAPRVAEAFGDATQAGTSLVGDAAPALTPASSASETTKLTTSMA